MAVSNLARQSVSSRHGAQRRTRDFEKAIGRNRNGMSEIGKITGWLAGGPPERRQRPGRASSGTTICVSTISLAEDWQKGGFGTGGQGSNITPA